MEGKLTVGQELFQIWTKAKDAKVASKCEKIIKEMHRLAILGQDQETFDVESTLSSAVKEKLETEGLGCYETHNGSKAQIVVFIRIIRDNDNAKWMQTKAKA
jgi:hypothetical protein